MTGESTVFHMTFVVSTVMGFGVIWTLTDLRLTSEMLRGEDLTAVIKTKGGSEYDKCITTTGISAYFVPS